MEVNSTQYPTVLQNNEDTANELFSAWNKLNVRGLIHASKFIAELMVSIDAKPNVAVPMIADPTYLLAKNYFDVKEYYRAAHCLENSTSPHSLFLKNYSRYLVCTELAGEKTKSEESVEIGGRRPCVDPSHGLERCPVKNRLLYNIKEELHELYEKRALDGFGLYLYGVVLREMSYIGNARTALVESLALEPCNWSAWLDLAPLLPDKDILEQLELPKTHWIYQFFLAHLYLELLYPEESMEIYNGLAQQFPNNTYILAQQAKTAYSVQDLEKSELLFDHLASIDPFRIATMDTYSNVLYVSEKHAKLSYLAYKASSTDKYSPEANVIIGNYYSLKADHYKAVKYFQRALALNPRYLVAWTLMGHEYIEMKVPNSAIPAYRKAVDINPKDYRAWYGLGMSYEIFGMPLYALYYYAKACALRPHDTTMWCALADCYDANDNTEEAIKCLKRVEANPDKLVLFKLAKCYKKLGQMANAAYYFKKNLDYRDAENIEVDQDQIDGIQFLAQYCKDTGNFEHATVR